MTKLSFVLALSALAVPLCTSFAQDVLESHLSFAEAQQRLLQRSDAIDAAKANLRSKEAQQGSTLTLRRPDLDFEARVLDYQKTLELPLGSLAPAAEAFGIENPLVFRQESVRFRPVLTAQIPIYTGGQIDAVQTGAIAQVDEASAELDIAAQNGVMQLAQTYFGQQLAHRALDVRKQVMSGLEQHLSDAQKLEREGFISRAQLLQAQVARDDAVREYRNALNDLSTASAYLSGLLRVQIKITPTTPLFVNSTPIGTVEEFIGMALDAHPQLSRMKALKGQAQAGVGVEKAKLRPTIYGFAQYDLYRDDALLTDPDWIFGIGVKYKIFGGAGRKQSERAAREKVYQSEAGLRETQVQLEISVTKAFNDLESARDRFLLLESAMASAAENLRLQSLSYREGLATSLDVVDAQLGVGRANIQRAQAAYDYDIALASLLHASGQTLQMPTYIARADRTIE